MANCANPVTQGKTQDRGTGVPLRAVETSRADGTRCEPGWSERRQETCIAKPCALATVCTHRSGPQHFTRRCGPVHHGLGFSSVCVRHQEETGPPLPGLRSESLPLSFSETSECQRASAQSLNTDVTRTSQKPWLMAHRHDHVLRYGQ